jgi:hypothetical protein
MWYYSGAPRKREKVRKDTPLPVFVLGLWIGGPGLVLLAAATMRNGSGRNVLIPWWDIPLPETCTLYSRFGIDCPGCGLTRGFIYLAHGDPISAWELNPLSWLLFAYIAVQIPIAMARACGVSSHWLQCVIGVNQWGLPAIMLLMVLRWGMNLVLGGF